MNCLQVEEQFSGYLEDELDYQSVKAFERHLTDCEQCRYEFSLFRESLNLLHQLPRITPSAEFNVDMQIRLAGTQIESVPFSARLWNMLRIQPVWGLSGIAALLIMFAAIYLYQSTFVAPRLTNETTINSYASSERIPRLSSVEISSRKAWEQELPIAIPNLRPEPLFRVEEFPAFDIQQFRERQQPQRIEQNYILQTVRYTDAPTGGGL